MIRLTFLCEVVELVLDALDYAAKLLPKCIEDINSTHALIDEKRIFNLIYQNYIEAHS